MLKKLLGIKIYPRYQARQLYQEAIDAGLKDKLILLIWEARSICPPNFSPQILNKFNRIITWDDDQLKDPKFIRYWKPMETPPIVKRAIPFNEKNCL